jgi:hypothetical protein
MSYTLDDEEQDRVQCIKKSVEVIKRVFGRELAPKWTFEVNSRIFCYEEAVDQQTSYEQLKKSFELSKEIFGEVNGVDPESVFAIYDAVFDVDDDEDDY